jgi:predicted kinase
VVLDASWSAADRRATARWMAAGAASPVVELECTCPADVAAERIAARQRRGDDPSEATIDVAATLAARFDPWPEAVRVDTTGPVAAAGDSARAALRQVVAAAPPVEAP